MRRGGAPLLIDGKTSDVRIDSVGLEKKHRHLFFCRLIQKSGERKKKDSLFLKKIPSNLPAALGPLKFLGPFLLLLSL